MDLRKHKTDAGFASAIAWLPDPAGLKEERVSLPEGPLSGMSYLAKDLFDVAGWPTTASSTFLEQLRAAPKVNAALVDALYAAGAQCVGKTHLNEFAYGLSGENAHFGDCPHPVDTDCLSGGSSSGSAYAVAKGWVPFALGTDTGGSIRVPAAFCGVWGIRYMPHVLMEGCFPLAPSFDTVGFLADSRPTLAKVHRAVFPQEGERGQAVPNVPPVVAFSPEWCSSSREANHYMEAFALRGLAVDTVLSADMNRWMGKLPDAYSILQSREALSVHQSWLDTYADAYDPATYGRIERARHWSDAQIREAEATAEAFNDWLEKVMLTAGVLAMPATPCPSPPKNAVDEAFRSRLLALTTPASLAGLPVLLEPVTATGLPRSMGIQYICRDMNVLDGFLANFR